jgi:hypothetical protein
MVNDGRKQVRCILASLGDEREISKQDPWSSRLIQAPTGRLRRDRPPPTPILSPYRSGPKLRIGVLRTLVPH